MAVPSPEAAGMNVSAETTAIRCHGFGKTFRVGFWGKKVEAAKSISFEVNAGEVFGFVGPNGAGKTTTIKALLGLIRPSTGSLSIFGSPPPSMGWRGKVGYMPENPTFYDFLSAHELVAWFGRLQGLSSQEADVEAKRHLGRVGLGHVLTRRLRKFSKGMVQRTGLAQAMMGSPSLLILDEPMTGLDPIGRREIRNLICDLREEGKTVFYSTHILPDIEMTCDRVCIIHQGETKEVGTLQDILAGRAGHFAVAIKLRSDAERDQLAQQHPSSCRIHEDEMEISFSTYEQARAFAGSQLAQGAQLSRFQEQHESLEDMFIRALGAHQESPS
jgi:ABC-2 type transport system ATP-binding protein